MSKKLLASIASLLIGAQAQAYVCTQWSPVKLGTLQRDTISEASGMVVSNLQKDKFIWTNDSGNSSDLYATDKVGKVVRTVRLNNFSNSDFEALSLGPCPSNRAESCIYVGDIGDGMGWRSSFKIGIFKEKDFFSSTSISPEKVINYSYPNGAQNAESMVVTAEGKIHIFSKNESGVTQIYAIDSVSSKISHLGQVSIKGIVADARGKGPRLTDASLSADNKRLLLLTYGDILEVDFDLFVSATPSKSWRKGIDFNVIKGPAFPQQETITYVNAEGAFAMSTESPNGEAQDIIAYTCR